MHVVDPEMTEKIGHDVVTAETMNVKILVKGPDEGIDLIKVELLSNYNYYFLYEHTCDVFDYNDMREMQSLHPQFADYLTMLIKLFNQAITNPDTYKCQVQLNRDNNAEMFFNQILPYKQLQLLGLTMLQGEEARVH